MQKRKLSVLIIRVISAAVLLVFVALEMFKVQLVQGETHNLIVNVLVTRTFAAIFFLTVLIESKDRVADRRPAQDYLKSLLFVIPALLVAINNMPMISLITGRCRVNETPLWVALFALECIAVGAFEEIAFRGVLFPYFLKKCKTRPHIFLCIAGTSCLFGLYHLFNLLEGAGFGNVIRQVGYSALIGAMCAICMLITGDIAVPVVLHAVYNFCGLLIDTVGEGEMWDTPTIVITIVLGVLTFAFYLVIFLKKKSFRLFESLKGGEGDKGSGGIDQCDPAQVETSEPDQCENS